MIEGVTDGMTTEAGDKAFQETHDNSSGPSWFSANVRLVCLIEPEGATRYNDSVFVFRAMGYSDAFGRAVALGRTLETDYMNTDGQRVAWRLKEVISLDMIMSESLDGVEVYSEPVDLAQGEHLPFDAEFHPEESQPTETLG